MSGLHYKADSDQRLSQLAQGDFKGAMPSGDSDSVLYNMEAGSLQRMEQDYQKSNRSFGKAQAIIAVWNNSWKNTTTGAVTSGLASMLLNDNVNAYEAKGFERSFVATFSALNQLDLNNLGNARVAIKQMYETERAIQNYRQALYNAARQAKRENNQKDKLHNYLYQQITHEYNFQDINSPGVLKLRNSYQNAFGHYLAGFVFEALNEPSLARPGYLKAGQLNPDNKLIQQSINNIDKNVRPTTGKTSLLVVQAVGHAPQIKSIQASMPVKLSDINKQAACVSTVTIFYPKLIVDNVNKASYPYQLDGQTKMPMPMANVNLMAERALSDAMPHIILRNISAMVRDIATSQLACRQKKNNQNGVGDALSLGSTLLSVFLNRADERTWILLPAHININRQTLPYGKHTISVNIGGVIHTLRFTLNKPYQVLAYRIIGKRVFFEPEQSMEAS